ncbi:hypothetical protein [Marinactinospora rubrisoli]|uniref:Uncharacterized protein n=1 Tax=Marinactinospora rubrisoli TaxID=2715399 RepID=A0ABW2KDL6_9ACTN
MSADEDERGGRRIDLSFSQVVGGGLATLAAATAASYLGVYGTIIGAAVMSVLSTAGTPVVQHLLSRSRETARDLAGRPNQEPGPRRPPVPPVTPGKGDTETRTDEAETAAFDAAPVTEPFRSAATDGSGTRTEPLPLGAAASAGAPDGDHEEASGGSGRWRGRALVLPAVALFVAVMVVITGFELYSGRSLSDTVRGGGTSSGPSLLGGTGGGAAVEPTPAATPESGTGTGDPGGDATREEPGTTPAPGGDTGGPDDGATTEPTAPAPAPGADDGPSEGQDGTGSDGTDDGSTGTGTGEDAPADQHDPAVPPQDGAPGTPAP